MVFAVVLAGGVGSRMGNTQTPKQYLPLGSKPIIVHTIEKFFVNAAFEKVLVLCPKAWVAHTRNMVVKSLGKTDRVEVIEGGSSRNDTVYRALCHIESNYGMDEETVIVTHDAVRPFVTHRIGHINHAGRNELINRVNHRLHPLLAAFEPLLGRMDR